MDELTIEFIGDFIEFSGKVLIAWTALAVHHRFKHEHKIDEAVFKAMHRETRFGMIGIGLLILGFLIRAYARYII